MFARKVAVRLKPNSLAKFTNLIECEILPWLRQQEGFLELITLAAPDGSEVATISFWDREEDAQAYKASVYPEVLQMLEQLLDGVPYVKTFNVVRPTLQRIVPARPPKKEKSEKQNPLDDTGPISLGYRAYESSV